MPKSPKLAGRVEALERGTLPARPVGVVHVRSRRPGFVAGVVELLAEAFGADAELLVISGHPGGDAPEGVTWASVRRGRFPLAPRVPLPMAPEAAP